MERSTGWPGGKPLSNARWSGPSHSEPAPPGTDEGPSRRREGPSSWLRVSDLEVHVSAAAVTVATGSACGLLLGDVRDQRLRRQDHRRDRGRVLEGGPGHLAGVHDPLLEHVAILVAERVVAVADLGLL